jgi:cytochrome c-type biogenesis protein CcmH/NrfG
VAPETRSVLVKREADGVEEDVEASFAVLGGSMARKRILLIALVAVSIVGLFAVNQALLLAESTVEGSSTSFVAEEAMSAANQLYESGQFGLAAHAYEQLVKQGFADVALFYNLGNAYFQQGDYGRAILNYRRAQELDPRDADVQANLDLARAQTLDEFEAADERGYFGGGLISILGRTVKSRFSLNELAMATLGAWMLFMLLTMLVSSSRPGSAWRRGLNYGLVAAAVVLTVSILSLGSYLHVEQNEPQGVIVAAKVEVSSGPGTQYVTEVALHGGAEVGLREARGSWVRLVLPGGEMEGWVPADAVQAVRTP